MEQTYFTETQSFHWLWLVPALVALLFITIAAVQIITGKPVGNRPIPTWAHLLIGGIVAIGAIVLTMQKLRTKITNKAVYIDFGLIASTQTIALDDIKTIKIRKYDGMSEFSGWGEKGNANEISYTVSGDEGIEIELKSGGKKILIGTHEPEEVQKIITQYLLNK